MIRLVPIQNLNVQSSRPVTKASGGNDSGRSEESDSEGEDDSGENDEEDDSRFVSQSQSINLQSVDASISQAVPGDNEESYGEEEQDDISYEAPLSYD